MTSGLAFSQNHHFDPLQEFWNSLICLYEIKRKNLFKSTCLTGSFTCPGPSGSGKRRALDIIKWKQFLCYWPFVRGIHRSPVNSPHKGQWRRALMFSLICARIYGWVHNDEAGDLRCHHTHNDVTVIQWQDCIYFWKTTYLIFFQWIRINFAWVKIFLLIKESTTPNFGFKKKKNNLVDHTNFV